MTEVLYYPGVIEIAAHYDIGASKDAVNVTHWAAGPTPPSVGELTTAQTTFNTWWNAWWSTLAATSSKYKGCIVTDKGSATGLQVRNDTFSPIAGTLTGGPVADNVALLISLKTATRYRGGKGRLYVPGIGIAATANDGRTVLPTTQSNCDTGMATLRTHMSSLSFGGSIGCVQCVWHRRGDETTLGPETILTSVTQTVLASQRRRLRKVSRHKRVIA